MHKRKKELDTIFYNYWILVMITRYFLIITIKSCKLFLVMRFFLIIKIESFLVITI